ncbi:MAG: flagellin lysine-N-methylase [Clostridia bacterium]|nr:flagellin lysine-N-methylase [Clostridia bacterium]
MKTFVPDYYPKFHCIAGKCRHSCCIGWEIDIDEDTLDLYDSIGGGFGMRLKNNIEPGDPPHFRLCADERCPFLNADGLCDIILTLGEGALCQICDDHPRFRSFYSDRVEMGIGMCCEAAAKLILSKPEKTVLVPWDDDGEEEFPLTEEETAFFDRREKLIAAAQNREKSVDERMQEILAVTGADLSTKTDAGWLACLREMECLDPARNGLLDEASADDLPGLTSEFETASEQILVYFLLRHLPGALDDGRFTARAAFAVLSTHVIRRLSRAVLKKNGTLTLDDIAEAARMYSSEYEYSDENTELLLEMLGGMD